MAVWLGLFGVSAEFAAAAVSIADASVVEGDSGTVFMAFTVTQQDSSEGGTDIDYATADQTAQAPADYAARQGTVSLGDSEGDTNIITVPVNGDTLDEPNETFRVILLDAPEGSDTEAIGTIVDDDGPPDPDPDSDGDGVPDSADACPTVPGPAPSGCPSMEDSDGDGVPNANDACPLVAGTMPDGCPATVFGLPPPVVGTTANLLPLRGRVFVRLPAGSAAGGGPRAAQKGSGFVPLEQARQVPIGTFVNTRRGTVRLATARNFEGEVQFGNFASGLFQVLQARRNNAITRLPLKGSRARFRRCRRARRSAVTASAAQRRRLSRRVVRRLRARARGRYRTRGRHSAATVRGTVWLTVDRCDGTLTRVRRGRVAVRDFRRRRTVVLRSGKRYLAQP